MATSRRQRVKPKAHEKFIPYRQFALQLKCDDAISLAPFRTVDELQICMDGGFLWLWCSAASEDLVRKLKFLPAIQRYYVLDNRDLIDILRNVPTATLPTGPWIKLSDWMMLELPDTSLPADINDTKIELRLVPASQEKEITGLMTTLAGWRSYAESTSGFRLELCHFAANTKQRVFIIGNPLPPLPGQRYYETNGIWIAAGYKIYPQIQPAIARSILGLNDDELLIWTCDGQLHKLYHTDFTQANRISIRSTVLHWSEG